MLGQSLSPNDAKQIERYLFRLSADEGIASTEDECNVLLEVLEAGQWIIKFRRHGIIVNNCELVLRDGIKIDASVSFFTLGNFWATINGAMMLEEGAMSTSGSEMAMHLFRTKVLKCKLDEMHGMTTSPTRVSRPSSFAEDKLPLRSGWLLKKRDLFTGWRSRYFKVYVGRVEYFAEARDTVPRAVIPLLNARITPAGEIRINREGKSYQIIVEPRFHEKCFKLASELTGEDGKQDAESWYMAFDIATKPVEQAHALLSGTKMAGSGQSDQASMPIDPLLSAPSPGGKGKFGRLSFSNPGMRPAAKPDELYMSIILIAVAAVVAMAGSLGWILFDDKRLSLVLSAGALVLVVVVLLWIFLGRAAPEGMILKLPGQLRRG